MRWSNGLIFVISRSGVPYVGTYPADARRSAFAVESMEEEHEADIRCGLSFVTRDVQYVCHHQSIWQVILLKQSGVAAGGNITFMYQA